MAENAYKRYNHFNDGTFPNLLEQEVFASAAALLPDGESDQMAFLGLTPEMIFAYYDYKTLIPALESCVAGGITLLEGRIAGLQKEADDWDAAKESFKNAAVAYRSRILHLCSGSSGTYGKWGLGTEQWNDFNNRYVGDVQYFVTWKENCLREKDKCEADLGELKNMQARLADRGDFEASLSAFYSTYKAAEKDARDGMNMVDSATASLRKVRRSFPNWLNDALTRTNADESTWGIVNYTDWQVYHMFIEGKTGDELKGNIASLISQIKNIPENEDYWLNKIMEGRMLVACGGDDSLPPVELWCAAYDGDRLLGLTATYTPDELFDIPLVTEDGAAAEEDTTAALTAGSHMTFRAEIPCTVTGPVTVKVFTLENGTLTPLCDRRAEAVSVR